MAKRSLGIHCQDCVRPPQSELVIRFYLQSLARDLLPSEKVRDCMRVIAPYRSNVEIVKSDISTRAHYRNLVVCGRIWQCAVCASTITEERRKELTLAIAQSGLYPVMITYTLRHNKTDKLPDLLKALLDAFRVYKSGRSWKNFTHEYSWVGSVRALEVTHGLNGWHPHLHELALLETPITNTIEGGITRYAKRHWRESIQKQGHDATWEHGADVKTEEHDIREYVAKYGRLPIARRWSVEHELTKAAVKRGRIDGRTPMQLLLDYGDGDKGAGALFVEYSRAFKGRNQLVWSRGLRERLGIEGELSDEQLAENQGLSGNVLATLTREDWMRVLAINQRAQLLEFASTASADQLADYINEILYGEMATAPA